jgi:glutamine synthetase
MLHAGLDGIQRELEAPPISDEDLYHLDDQGRQARGLGTLPGSLGEALEELKTDALMQEALGEHILERFVEAKAIEWHDYRTQVDTWELDRYLRIY